jgi:glycolate dehydrogenase FAD-binding subunit
MSPQPLALSPQTREELAESLAEADAVRFVGGGTKPSWGSPVREPNVELSTSGLDRIVEHNEGDLTAVLEAGVPLAVAQDRFAQAGQMLALDPPDGGATLGGVFATADSGPLRSRYGGPRDVIVGVVAALSDGTLVKAGGKVIKNVAGYDLAKLFTGSMGTLGAIVEVSVRLHPVPEATATAAGSAADPGAVAAGAAEVARSPLEHLGLDVRFGGGTGAVLARFGGTVPGPQAAAAGKLLSGAGLDVEIVDEDDAPWSEQRKGQRSPDGTVVRLSALPSGLGDVLEEARRLDAPLVGRAGLGLSWLRLEDREADEAAAAVEALRREHPCTVIQAPAEVCERLDPWGEVDEDALELMRRVKRSFDPRGACNPGVFLT